MDPAEVAKVLEKYSIRFRNGRCITQVSRSDPLERSRLRCVIQAYRACEEPCLCQLASCWLAGGGVPMNDHEGAEVTCGRFARLPDK
jgi:hypothetical protein